MNTLPWPQWPFYEAIEPQRLFNRGQNFKEMLAEIDWSASYISEHFKNLVTKPFQIRDELLPIRKKTREYFCLSAKFYKNLLAYREFEDFCETKEKKSRQTAVAFWLFWLVFQSSMVPNSAEIHISYFETQSGSSDQNWRAVLGEIFLLFSMSTIANQMITKASHNVRICQKNDSGCKLHFIFLGCWTFIHCTVSEKW